MKVFVAASCVLALLASFSCKSDPAAEARGHLARGRQYLVDGRHAEARIEFRSALQLDRKMVEAHLGLGESAAAMGYLQEAIESYYEAMKLAPGSVEARIGAGSLLLRYSSEESIGEAERLAADLVKSKPDSADAQLLLANALIARGEWDGAVTALDRASGLAPGRIDALIARARYFSERARADRARSAEFNARAEAAFGSLVESRPLSSDARLAYGDYLFSANRMAEAEKQLVAAIASDPRNRLALGALQRYYESQGRYDEAEKCLAGILELENNRPEGRAEIIDLHARAGRPGQAVVEYRQLVAERPDFIRGYARLAELLMDAGEAGEAGSLIEAALRRSPQDTDALLMRGKLRIADGRYREALGDLDQVLRFEPSQTEALYLAADANLLNHDPAQARLAANRLLSRFPNNPMGTLSMARIQMAESRMDEAERTATQALENISRMRSNLSSRTMAGIAVESLPEWEGRALVTRAICRIGRRDFAGAARDLEECLRIDPRSSEARINLAVAHLARGRLDESAREAEKALILAPSSAAALSTLNDALIGRGRYDEALAKIDSLAASQGERPHILEQKARILAARKDIDGAERTLRRIIEKNPEYLNAYFALSDLYQSSGRGTDRAIAELARIISLKPAGPSQIAQAHLLTALLEESRGNLDQASRNYEASLGYDKRSAGAAIAFNNLAWLYADRGMGNLDQAVDYARSAIAVSPEASFFDTLGYAYFKKGQFDTAIEQFQKAIQRNPGNKTFRRHLSMAEEKKRDGTKPAK